MDSRNGDLYASLDDAIRAGVKDPVEISGPPEVVQSISKAVRAQHRAKRKVQKKARRRNR